MGTAYLSTPKTDCKENEAASNNSDYDIISKHSTWSKILPLFRHVFYFIHNVIFFNNQMNISELWAYIQKRSKYICYNYTL